MSMISSIASSPPRCRSRNASCPLSFLRTTMTWALPRKGISPTTNGNVSTKRSAQQSACLGLWLRQSSSELWVFSDRQSEIIALADAVFPSARVDELVPFDSEQGHEKHWHFMESNHSVERSMQYKAKDPKCQMMNPWRRRCPGLTGHSHVVMRYAGPPDDSIPPFRRIGCIEAMALRVGPGVLASEVLSQVLHRPEHCRQHVVHVPLSTHSLGFDGRCGFHRSGAPCQQEEAGGKERGGRQIRWHHFV